MRLLALLSVAALAAAAVPAVTTAGFMLDPITKQPIVNKYKPHGIGSSPVKKTIVEAPGKYRPGTIVVNTSERRLYLIQEDGKAIKYGIGVGREGFQWGGTHSITMKREWPDWRPPEPMLKRRPDLPRFMPGGPNNPLGARALYIGDTIFRIHGSNEPHTIGQAVSSGCFRMSNQDVVDLYDRVKIGTRVVVLR